MNQLEQELHYPLADRVPEAGQAIQITPGICGYAWAYRLRFLTTLTCG